MEIRQQLPAWQQALILTGAAVVGLMISAVILIVAGVSASGDATSNLITITVTGGSPTRTAEVANAFDVRKTPSPIERRTVARSTPHPTTSTPLKHGAKRTANGSTG